VKVSAPRMDGLSGGSGECLNCPASVAGAEGWQGVFQQPVSKHFKIIDLSLFV